MQGLFDIPARLEQLKESGDPLVRLNGLVDWQVFRPTLERVHEKERKSAAGAKPYDVVMMFKLLVLQSLYNLSDEGLEYQVLDRLSFMRFLGLDTGDKVPDATTVWRFREALTQLGLERQLFVEFNEFLRHRGFEAHKGQIVDASIVSARRQENSKEENAKIKAGERVEEWSEAKRRQKDVDARWTRKNNKNYFGYKNHVQVDAGHKLIRNYAVTDAASHESQVFEDLLDDSNDERGVWADSAYHCARILEHLARGGWEEHVNRQGRSNRPLTPSERQENRQRSRIRSRIEHVYGAQLQRAGNLILRTVGWVRVRCKIGLRNLTYNIDRYAFLADRAA